MIIPPEAVAVLTASLYKQSEALLSIAKQLAAIGEVVPLSVIDGMLAINVEAKNMERVLTAVVEENVRGDEPLPS